MKKKRSKKQRFIKKYIVLLIFIILLSLVLIKAYLRSPMIVYARQKAYYFSSVLINDAISRQIVPNIDIDKIVKIETRSSGYVTSVVIDVHQINMLISEMTRDIQNQLLAFQNDENHDLNRLSIPLGAIFNHPLFTGLGPNININLRMIGSVYTDIVSSAKPYGINNSLIEINILTKVKFQVAIPLQKTEIEVETHTPLLIKVIQGSVPHYYYLGGGSGTVINPPPNSNSQPGPEDDILEG
jgi:sporulation protein YunB